MKWLKRIGITVLALVVLAYGAVCAYFYFNQRSLQYSVPDRIVPLTETTLTAAAEVQIPTADGTPLMAWYEAPQPGKPLILYYRGNSGSFTREHARYEAFVQDGYGFVAFDYRGFPGSPGEITQAHVLEDSLAAFDWAKAKGFPMVVWGRSLGSASAVYTMGQREADALWLETPFLNFAKIGADHYPYLPVGLLLLDQYPEEQWIKGVTEPVFVAHGTGDKTIPVYQGQALYDLVSNKAGIWIEPGADHDDLWKAGEWDKARAFFEAAEAEAGR